MFVTVLFFFLILNEKSLFILRFYSDDDLYMQAKAEDVGFQTEREGIVGFPVIFVRTLLHNFCFLFFRGGFLTRFLSVKRPYPICQHLTFFYRFSCACTLARKEQIFLTDNYL